MSERVQSLIAEGGAARRDGRRVDARRAYESAASAARGEGLSAHLVTALKGIGQIERDLGHLETSSSYEEALAAYSHAS